MTSIDELFKKPTFSTGKRKFDPAQDANEVYKASKSSSNSDVKTNGRKSQVEDDEDDVEAGPELPPEEADDIPDDEDGRFFGGGVNKNTVQVLDYIDGQEEESTGPEKYDLSWLRRVALNFEKRVSKNAELRAKFDGEPAKFMSSEADLDDDIKALSILSEHTDLYEEFAKLGCVSSLVSLLSHENTDIAIDAIEIINELTDDDVVAQQHQWDALVDALLDADLLSLLYDNLSRLDESQESDRAGIYHILSVVENVSSRSSIADQIGKETGFLKWLLRRIQISEVPTSQNKEYSAEVLTILLQSSSSNRKSTISFDGIDGFLRALSSYRKRDPEKDSEEEGYVENVFDSLTCCVDEGEGKAQYIHAEGIELCLLMLREGKMSKPRALCVLDHALGGPDGRPCCEKMIDAAGLKPLFSALIKKSDNKSTEHILGILSSMLRSLPANDAPRIRLLAKFVEKNYHTINRIFQIRRECASRVATVDKAINAEKAVRSEDERQELASQWFLQRLDAGLYVLQTIDTILAWLVAEDAGAKSRILELLAEDGKNLESIRKTLQEQLDGMTASSEDDDPMMKDMLSALIDQLT